MIIPSMDIPGTVLTLAYWTDQGFRPESRGALYKIEDILRDNPLTDTFGGLTPEEVQDVKGSPTEIYKETDLSNAIFWY